MTARTVAEAKAQAKALRSSLATEGTAVSHAQALELVARQNGERDWNTLSARLRKTDPRPFHLHQRVEGQYLGQHFKGEITGLSSLGAYYSVTIRFDEPVDAVTFESFSNMRRVVRATVDRDGKAISKTSDGQPHLVLAPR